MGHLCSLLGRLPKAKIPKKDFYACSDALFTIFKGHIIAAACLEMGLPSPDSTLATTSLKTMSQKEKRVYVVDLAIKVVDKCTIIPDALLH